MSNTLNVSVPGRILRASIWVAQILIFLFFCNAARIKLLTPIPDLAAMWPWTGQFPAAFVRTTGIIDLLGGLGVLLPSLTRIMPKLTVAATVGLIALQICAILFHLSRSEASDTPLNFVLLAILAFILWGRRRVPIQPR